MMTKLEELKAAYEAATPGRWAYDDDGFVYGDMDDTQPTGGGYIVSDPHSSPEADLASPVINRKIPNEN